MFNVFNRVDLIVIEVGGLSEIRNKSEGGGAAVSYKTVSGAIIGQERIYFVVRCVSFSGGNSERGRCKVFTVAD